MEKIRYRFDLLKENAAGWPDFSRQIAYALNKAPRTVCRKQTQEILLSLHWYSWLFAVRRSGGDCLPYGCSGFCRIDSNGITDD